ncbi:MAG: hypothetical protein KF745_11255 [Phycisphaeraceae bacterium]|nr:hypothetical protein [Phycisphaeraceae bacterium]
MPADIPLRLLDRVRIASPCDMRWEDMTGDDRRRRCAKCDLTVHNFSNMTADEAETVLREATGRICAGFYRRADGTILTRECPVGLRAARERLVRAAVRVAAVVGLITTGGTLARSPGYWDGWLRSLPPIAWLADWVAPYLPGMAPPIRGKVFVAGDIACPPVPTAPSLTNSGESRSK